MYNERSTGYWVTAIIIVLAVATAVWWYTSTNASPLIPNTGAPETQDQASDPLYYHAQ